MKCMVSQECPLVREENDEKKILLTLPLIADDIALALTQEGSPTVPCIGSNQKQSIERVRNSSFSAPMAASCSFLAGETQLVMYLYLLVR